MNINNIQGLPEELLLRIFSFLSLEDLSLRAPLVCKSWNQFTQDNELWSPFYQELERTTPVKIESWSENGNLNFKSKCKELFRLLFKQQLRYTQAKLLKAQSTLKNRLDRKLSLQSETNKIARIKEK